MGLYVRKIFPHGKHSAAVVIPKPVMDGKRWKLGDMLEIVESNGDVIIRKVKEKKA